VGHQGQGSLLPMGKFLGRRPLTTYTDKNPRCLRMGRPAPAWLTPTPERLGKPQKSRASARLLIKNNKDCASRGEAEGRIVTEWPRPVYGAWGGVINAE